MKFDSNTFHNELDALYIAKKMHNTLPLCILDYDQYESPKFHPTVELCRGLVVDCNDLNIVAKPFNRFYNVGENNLVPSFPCTALSKIDGSLCIVYNYMGTWYVNSRYSWGDFYFDGAPHKFNEGVYSLLGNTNQHLDSNYTYIFEYVGPYNQVVLHYNDEDLYLLGIIDNTNHYELSYDEMKSLKLPYKMPDVYTFNNHDELSNFIDECQTEGLVIQKGTDHPRLKLKTKRYLEMHKLKSGLSNTLKSFLELWVSGEVASVVLILPEYKSKFTIYNDMLNNLINDVHKAYDSIKNIPNQKDFAQEALKYKFSNLLFNMRKGIHIKDTSNLANTLERLLS
jgi:tRNA splicing ligase